MKGIPLCVMLYTKTSYCLLLCHSDWWHVLGC